jgi:uncharacterized protein YmfQ (DUF2313 family)
MFFLNPLKELMMTPNEATNPVPDQSILAIAEGLVNGQRQQDYGDKLQNFSQISMLWQGYLAMKLGPDARITPEDVAMMMMLVKMARLAKSPDHLDSLVDIAGYARCMDMLQIERKNLTVLPGALRDARG